MHRFVIKAIKCPLYKSRLGYCGKNVVIRWNSSPRELSYVYMYDNTSIYHDFVFISKGGKFIMKEGSSAAQRLTVITGNHGREVGLPFRQKDGNIQMSQNKEEDVVVGEDVWIGSDVTLCAGVTIGRCSNIGAGSVVRHSIPPYSIVIGNPAKIVGFCFTPEEIFEHEKSLYPESERLPLELLKKNYEKYFLKRLKDIKEYSKL